MTIGSSEVADSARAQVGRIADVFGWRRPHDGIGADRYQRGYLYLDLMWDGPDTIGYLHAFRVVDGCVVTVLEEGEGSGHDMVRLAKVVLSLGG
jgi:hypothetical protein